MEVSLTSIRPVQIGFLRDVNALQVEIFLLVKDACQQFPCSEVRKARTFLECDWYSMTTKLEGIEENLVDQVV